MCVQSGIQLAFTEWYFEFKPKLSLEILNIPAFSHLNVSVGSAICSFSNN